MANKDFKVKNGIDIQSPLPVSMGGTGQTSSENTLNALLPTQAGNQNKVLSTDGTNTTWIAQSVAYQRGSTAQRPQTPAIGDLYYNTELNYFESYTANGWFPIAAAPLAPTGVTATNQGSGRAYDNGQMSVAFTPNSSGGAPTSFIVTPSPSTSPSTFTGSTSPITVTGLASSTQYTYTVQSTSPYGTSAASTASSGVTATTVPQAPTIGTATADSENATITFTPGATGGASATYTATSSPGGLTGTSSSSPITVSGLTAGQLYTFTITATNSNGTSLPSAESNSVELASDLGSMVPIATFTLASTQATIDFTNIPQTYTHLQLRVMGRTNRSSATVDSLRLRFNNDTNTNYSQHFLQGNGSGVVVEGNPNLNLIFHSSNTATDATAGIYGVAVIDILDYRNVNKYKTTKALVGADRNGAGVLELVSGNWRDTNAITSIQLTAIASYVANSSFALYGVKA